MNPNQNPNQDKDFKKQPFAPEAGGEKRDYKQNVDKPGQAEEDKRQQRKVSGA